MLVQAPAVLRLVITVSWPGRSLWPVKDRMIWVVTSTTFFYYLQVRAVLDIDFDLEASDLSRKIPGVLLARDQQDDDWLWVVLIWQLPTFEVRIALLEAV